MEHVVTIFLMTLAILFAQIIPCYFLWVAKEIGNVRSMKLYEIGDE